MDESRPEVMLADVVEASRAVAATRSRTAKTQALADLLTRCAPEEVGTVVSHLSGVLPQRRLGVGFRSLRDLPEPAQTPTLTVLEVDAAFERLASAHGTGSTASRRSELSTLMSRATSVEQQFLRDLMTGNLRQGALDGVVLAAISAAYAVPAATVRRAAMLAGTAAEVATLAMTGGSRALEDVSLVVGRPVRPMLAASAKTTGEAAESIGESELIVDGKLDGIRVQVHRRGGEVTVYTRSLDEITDRVPEVVEAVAALPGGDLVVDGEAIVLRADGRPEPFQVTGARTASSADLTGLQARMPLTTFLFDVLHVGGRDLLDESARVRHEVLLDLAPHLLVPRLLTDDPRRRGAVLRRPRRRRARRCRRQGRRQPVCRRAARQRVGQGQAGAHAGPRGARGRVGIRAAGGQSVEHPPRGARPGDRRVHDGGQDVQGHDRRGAGVADQALRRARRRRHRRVGGSGEAGAGRRDRRRRGATLQSLPGGRGAAVRPGAALSRRQGGRCGRHDRHRSRLAVTCARRWVGSAADG
jgi:hypothetical protein